MAVVCTSCSRRDFLKASAWAAAAATLPRATAQEPAAEREADHYEPMDHGVVRCTLCPRGCVVPPGGQGYCRVRVNRGGRYLTRVYGYPVALNNDPIEKKPFYHVYPGSKAFSIATVGCNIHCKFCQNWDISQASPDNVSLPYRRPADIARMASEMGSRVVAYTYNEPTVFYEYMADCARAAKEAGLGNVMVSNGFIAETPLRELCKLMTAIKIDFKAFSERFYADLCEGQLQPVLDTLKRLADSGVWFEMVVLVIPTLNDDLDEIRRMSEWIVKEVGTDVPLHFTRFHPAYRIRNLPMTPVATLHKARQLALDAGCRFVYTGGMPGAEGEKTYCPQCKATVLARYGFWVVSDDLQRSRCPHCGATVPGIWS